MLRDNIKTARIKKGWSQQDLANEYNLLVKKINKQNNLNLHTIGRTSITHWETGRYTPEVESIPVLCEILQISADSLLGIDEIMKIQQHSQYEKNILLDDGTKISIHTNKNWEELTKEEKKEIMDSIIEESVKIKKEESKKN